MIKQQLSFQATCMLNLDSKIHVLCNKGNQRTEIGEDLSTIIVTTSPQLKRDATYDAMLRLLINFFLQICLREGETLCVNYQTRSTSPVDLQAQQNLVRKCIRARDGGMWSSLNCSVLRRTILGRYKPADC